MCTFVGGEEGGELVNTVWDHGLDTVQYSASSDPVYGEGIGPVWGRARGPIKEKTKKKKRRGKKEKDTIKKKLSCTLSQADERARNSKRGGGELERTEERRRLVRIWQFVFAVGACVASVCWIGLHSPSDRSRARTHAPPQFDQRRERMIGPRACAEPGGNDWNTYLLGEVLVVEQRSGNEDAVGEIGWNLKGRELWGCVCACVCVCV